MPTTRLLWCVLLATTLFAAASKQVEGCSRRRRRSGGWAKGHGRLCYKSKDSASGDLHGWWLVVIEGLFGVSLLFVMPRCRRSIRIKGNC